MASRVRNEFSTLTYPSGLPHHTLKAQVLWTLPRTHSKRPQLLPTRKPEGGNENAQEERVCCWDPDGVPPKMCSRHICLEKKGGLESQALLFLLFGVRGHLCRFELVWRKPGFVDEIQMQDYFAGCHAETFSRSWGGSADIFIAAEHARVQQLFRVSVHTGPSTRVLSTASVMVFSVLAPPRMPGWPRTTSCVNWPQLPGRRRSGGQKIHWGKEVGSFQRWRLERL